VTTAYPAEAPPQTAFAPGRADVGRAYRSAVRHSRRVRILRIGVLAGIAVLLLGVAAANYLPSIAEIRLPGELGKLVIKGTKITMQQPKLTGYTSDARSYEFTANAAAQDITNPDIVELQQLHARMEMADKSMVEMTAPSGIYDMKANTLKLNDDIAIASSSGYAARLKEARVDMHSGDVVSDQPISIKLINGLLNAKRMKVTEHDSVVRFDGGVSMTLLPEKSGDRSDEQ